MRTEWLSKSNGDAVVTGQISSQNFPATASAFEPENHDTYGAAAFVAEISGQTPACAYAVTPGSALIYPFGSSAFFSVVAPSGCAWTATPSAPWITVTSGTGPGVAPLAISVAANTGAGRKGTITIGSTHIDVAQPAATCTYTLSTYTPTFPQSGGPATTDVTTPAGCAWNVTNVPLWLTVTSGSSGVGNGQIVLQASANPFPGTRSSMLAIAGYAIFASQTGTGGAPAPQPSRPPVPGPLRCVPLGATCPAPAAMLRGAPL